jgi:hypothetical protein
MIRLVIAPLNYSSWSVRAWRQQPSVAQWTMLAEQSIAVPKYDAAL